MTYSVKRDDSFIEEFIEYIGLDKIPDPDQYPRRFEFMIKSFEHYKRMQEVESEN